MIEILAPIVLKFGGTSVKSRHTWHNIAELARSRAAGGAPVLIVVSALSTVTNSLEAINAATNACLQAELLDAVKLTHTTLLHELGLPASSLDERFAALEAKARLNPNDVERAELLAEGELLSSTLGAAFLQSQSMQAQWLDARDWLTAVAQPNQSIKVSLLSAICEHAADPRLLAQLAAARIAITQGFIARNPVGQTVLLGRGGSDTSAAYFGAKLNASRVEIWTDVPGMFTANPRRVPQARHLVRLSFAEAQEIATTGAKVLHPRSLTPLKSARTPLLVLDTNRPDQPGTLITHEEIERSPTIKALSYRSGITLVSMESIGMWQQVGFLADVFAAFKRHGLSVDLIGSAETNVTVSLDPSENLLDAGALEALCIDLSAICRVKVIAPCAAITMVGRGIRTMLHRLGPLLEVFDRQKVHLISQSSNDLNLTFVVDELIADELVPELHALLVKSRVMDVDDAAIYGLSWAQMNAAPSETLAPWWRADRSRLLKLAASYSPRYVYHLPTVRRQAQSLQRLDAVDRWLYALKANHHPAILRDLSHLGFDLECVSINEVEHALSVLPDHDPARILFTPNFADLSEYERGFAAGVRVTIDNLELLKAAPELFRNRLVWIRVDLGAAFGHHDKVKTAGEHSKFGVVVSDLPALRLEALALGLKIVGLHSHFGSGTTDVSAWKRAYAELASLAADFPQVEWLDIGGGLGVSYQADDVPLDLVQLNAALKSVKALYPQYRLALEPGRFLVAEAGVLLSRITQIKGKGRTRYLGIDTGMNSLIRPALYGAWHGIHNLSRLTEPATARYHVVGPICESGDVLGHDRALPESVPNEVILIEHAGAYGHVMSSNYNLREPAEEVAIDD